MEEKIKKTIHYCWFGKGEKPAIIKKCMSSWQKKCQDYAIVEWNENNFDVNICPYVKQAYEAGKYAFVSDYARFFVLNKFGGVYLDTDVELLKDISELLDNNFVGFESDNSVNTGLIMACGANDELCKAMLEEYDGDKFINDDGSFNLRTVCHRVTDWLVQKGLKLDGKTQHIGDYVVYAKDYFNPTDMASGKLVVTRNTYSIHRFAASWVKRSDRIRGKIYSYLVRIFGIKTAEKIRKIIGRKK